MPSPGAFPSDMDISECCCRCCCGHCETPGCRSRASRDTQHGSAYCMPQARIQHRITKELLLSDVSPEGCVCARERGGGFPPHRAPRRVCAQPPGFSLSLFLKENFLLPTEPPVHAGFPHMLRGSEFTALPGQHPDITTPKPE